MRRSYACFMTRRRVPVTYSFVLGDKPAVERVLTSSSHCLSPMERSGSLPRRGSIRRWKWHSSLSQELCFLESRAAGKIRLPVFGS